MLRTADPQTPLQTAEDKDESQSTTAWKFQPVYLEDNRERGCVTAYSLFPATL